MKNTFASNEIIAKTKRKISSNSARFTLKPKINPVLKYPTVFYFHDNSSRKWKMTIFIPSFQIFFSTFVSTIYNQNHQFYYETQLVS